MTINNCIIGNNWAYIGGGIYCEDSNAIVKNCSFFNNRADGADGVGGGFYGDNSNTLIDNCIFIENVAEDSGAAIYGCDGVISNSIIRNNKIPWEGHGGAISNCSGLIENCLIEGNYSNWGDGAGISRSSADIVSCVIRNNINDTGSLDVVPVIGTNDMPLNIGGRMGIHGFKGLIDEVRIYNRAVTLPEIELLSQSR